MRSYAIGDIHGHLDKLKAAHALIAADRTAVGDKTAPIVHVGDLVDRGPDVAGVIEHLANGVARGEAWIVLRGNHDRFMQLFLHDPEQRDSARPHLHWLDDSVGGRPSLASYGVDVSPDRPMDEIHAEALRLVPMAHRGFLDALLNSYRRGEVFFCHAGIKPGVPLDAQEEDDLLWIRREFHDDRREHGALIVHGHTPVKHATHYGNRLNIDSGAAYGGPLSAVVIEGRAAFLLTPEGRQPLDT